MSVKKYITNGSMYVWSLLRVVLGFVFLWAFLDKLFGLKVATCSSSSVGCSSAWINGGSPTSSFLNNAATGPFADFYHKLAGHGWVDWLFMLGLVFAGLGLLFGLWVRLASLIGIMLMLLMWTALLWPANTPGIDEHIIYALVLFGVALTADHQAWSLNSWWVKTKLVKSLPFLK